jgi:hypothetical protein
MVNEFTQTELEAYLDESLDAERMAEVEKILRRRPELLQQLARINARRDAGVHTVGEIWRRHQIGVPSREDLGSYVLGVLPPEHTDYIRFRVETLKCRFTIANLRDLEAQQTEAEGKTAARRRKYFQSSVGRLKE